MKSLTLFACLIYVAMFNRNAAQIVCLSEEHHTTIKSLDSYVESHELEFVNLSESEQSISIPCNQLGYIDEFSVEIEKKGSWKKSNLDKDLSLSTLDWSSFYSGVQYYQLPIPALHTVKVKYKTVNEHSIFVSHFPCEGFYGGNKIDFSLKIPPGFNYSFRNGDKISDPTIQSLTFRDSSDLFGVLHPSDQTPDNYFNDWFRDRTTDLLILDAAGEKIVEDLKTENNKEELAAELFYFVQSKIKYVDIENGIHAIVPRNCNETLKNGYGDCKDMATLLTALLRSAGFESYLAISRTNSRRDTLDFPSIALGNHMISVLRFNDQWIYLDPTENGCEFGDPSYQILGTEVLVLSDHPTNRFLYINNAPIKSAELDLSYSYELDNRTIRLEGIALGKMNLIFAMLTSELTEPDEYILKIFNHNGGWSLDSLSVDRESSTFVLSKSMPASRVTNIGTTTLLETSDIMDLSDLLSRFQFANFPKYGFNFTATIDFGESINEKNASDYQMAAIVGGSALQWGQSIPAYDSEESFFESDLYTDWKSLLNKPILLTE